MLCFTQQSFTQSGTSSVSLSVSHLVCYWATSFVSHPVNLAGAWLFVGYSVKQLIVLATQLVGQCLNAWVICLAVYYFIRSLSLQIILFHHNLICQSDILENKTVGCPFQSDASTFLCALWSKHKIAETNWQTETQNNKPTLAVTHLIDRVINRQTPSQSHSKYTHISLQLYKRRAL